MSRIAIDDLPEMQELSQPEIMEITGAGRPLRRKTKDSVPGIIQLEILELRQVMSATGVGTAADGVTSSDLNAAKEFSVTEKDAAGNLIYRHVVDGKEMACAVFTPDGAPLSYDRTSGETRVHTEFTNGLISRQLTYRNNTEAVRQEFDSTGKLTRESLYDSDGRLTVETEWTDRNRQVTEYGENGSAKITTYRDEVVIFKETWLAGKSVARATYSDSGALISKWATHGDYEFTTTVSQTSGLREEVTKLKGLVIRRELYTTQENLKVALSTYNSSKLAKAEITNLQSAELQLFMLATKPTWSETFDSSGKRLTFESWSFFISHASRTAAGKTTATLELVTKQTANQYSDTIQILQESTERHLIMPPGAKVESVRTIQQLIGGQWTTIQTETHTDGKPQTRTFIDGKRRQEEDFTTKLINGKMKTWVSTVRHYESGLHVSTHLKNANGELTRVELFIHEKGKKRLSLIEEYTGSTRKVYSYQPDSVMLYAEFSNKGQETLRQVFQSCLLKQEVNFHANGKMKRQWVVNGTYTIVTEFDEKQLKTLRTVSEKSIVQLRQEYLKGTEKPARLLLYNQAGKCTNETTWTYSSNGTVTKTSHDYGAKGYVVQKVVWVDGNTELYIVWEDAGKSSQALIEQKYLSGKVSSVREWAPDGTLIRSSFRGFRNGRFGWHDTYPRGITPPDGTSFYKSDSKSAAILYSGLSDKSFGLAGLKRAFSVPNVSITDTDHFSGLKDQVNDAGLKPLNILTNGQASDLVSAVVQKLTFNELKKLLEKVSPNELFKNLSISSLPKLNACQTILKGGKDLLISMEAKFKALSTSLPKLDDTTWIDSVFVKAFKNGQSMAQTADGWVKDRVEEGKNGAVEGAKQLESGVKQLEQEANAAKEAGKEAWSDAKEAAGKVASDIKGELNKDLIAFQADSIGKIGFNFRTGGYYADLELMKGLKLDTEKLKDWMSGNFTLPEINFMSAATNFVGMKSSVVTNYEAVRQKLYQEHGGGNVYFSSNRFSEWAGPETVARLAAVAVASGGTLAAKQAISEAKSQLILELQDIMTWLSQKGATEIPKLALQMMKAIATQSPLNLPELSIQTTQVNYDYKVSATGMGAQVAESAGADTTVNQTSPHFGYAIIWKGGSDVDPLGDALNALDSVKLSGGTGAFLDAAFAELEHVVPEGSDLLKELFSVAKVGVESDDSLEKMVVGKLTEIFGTDAMELARSYVAGNPIIDLTANQEISSRFNKEFGKLAIGNMGSAEITKLQFNLNTLSFEAEIVLHHKHSWGSLADMGKQLDSIFN